MRRVVSVNVGQAVPLDVGDRRVLSAIGKRPVAGRVAVRPLGLAGDEQADLSVHGGPGKAVYAYPIEHLPFWRTVRAQARVSLWDEDVPPGRLGENLSIEGLLEADAFIGDRLRFPDCEFAVSEPRFPCFKFNAAMGFRHAARMMSESGWCGFYLAVIVPGTIGAGDTFEHLHGPREVGIAELFRARMAGAKGTR
jgi:MOSC domain-containing protein YiiM